MVAAAPVEQPPASYYSFRLIVNCCRFGMVGTPTEPVDRIACTGSGNRKGCGMTSSAKRKRIWFGVVIGIVVLCGGAFWLGAYSGFLSPLDAVEVSFEFDRCDDDEMQLCLFAVTPNETRPLHEYKYKLAYVSLPDAPIFPDDSGRVLLTWQPAPEYLIVVRGSDTLYVTRVDSSQIDASEWWLGRRWSGISIPVSCVDAETIPVAEGLPDEHGLEDDVAEVVRQLDWYDDPVPPQ